MACLWRSAGMRRASAARIFFADGVYSVTHEFPKPRAREIDAYGSRRPGFAFAEGYRRVLCVLSARIPQSEGFSHRYFWRRAIVCSPDGVPIEAVSGFGCDASETDLSIVFGGPKEFAPEDVLRYADPKGMRAMLAIGSEIQFGASIIEYLRARME